MQNLHEHRALLRDTITSMRFLGLCVVLAACGPDGPAHRPPAELNGCSSSSLSPATTITSLTERVNQLPPSEPSCLLASLPRPIQLVASSSITSAQPATSPQSPRLFLIGAEVAISFVPDGDGAHLVEFGQWTSPTRTLKGELELPRAEAFALDAAFTRTRFSPSVSSCGLCHREEEADAATGGSTSIAFRPLPQTLVPLTTLAREHEKCTRAEDRSTRCVMFHALFDFGEVRSGAFDAEVALFGE